MSDIVYNFLLPEVEKESHKNRACNNENNKLWTAPPAFCDVMILNMPDDELLSVENSSDCANSTENQSVYYKSVYLHKCFGLPKIKRIKVKVILKEMIIFL